MGKLPLDRTGPTWSVAKFFVVVVALWLAVFVQKPSALFFADGDTFWHLETARWMYQHLSVPRLDVFSYTVKGSPWVDQEWLSDLVFFAAYRLARWAGVLLVAAIAGAVAITVVTLHLVRQLRFSVALAWAAVTAIAISSHLLARPHVFSFALTACWLGILLSYWDSNKFEQSTVLLSPIMILWANLHAGFAYGLAAYGVFSLFAFATAVAHHNYARCRAIAVAAMIVGASSLVTPYGIYSALLVVDVSQYTFVLRHITEWRSPDFQVFWVHAILLVGLLAATLFLGVRVRGPRLVLLSLTLIFGLTHLRGLIIFFLVAPILLARPFAEACTWLQPNLPLAARSVDGSGDPVLSAICRAPAYVHVGLGLTVILSVVWLRWDQLAIGPSQAIAPREAVDFVERTNVKGNVFNTYDFGGYLIFRGIPVFIDSRQPPYSDDFVRKAFEAVNLTNIAAAYNLLDRYGIAWVILSQTEPLARALAADPHWRKLYSDSNAAVFARRMESE